MIEFSVETKQLDKAIAAVNAVRPDQLAFIMALALTETTKDIKEVLQGDMRHDIDRPRPYTLNSLYTTRATKAKLESNVLWKDTSGKSGGHYLRPIAEGGGRPLKSSEIALKNRGLLPSGYYLAPGPDANLDQYGNVPGSVYVSMLSALKAFSENGYIANRTAKSEARAIVSGRSLAQWFIIIPGSTTRLPPGVYQRGKPKNKLIFNIVRDPKYRVIFPFYDIVTKAAIQRMPIQFDLAVHKALSTARPIG